MSICFIKDLRNGWYTWKRGRIQELWAKYAEDVPHDFAVDWWGRGGSLHLSKDDQVPGEFKLVAINLKGRQIHG